jgi:hypothetical protein
MVRGHLDRIPRATEWWSVTEIEITQFLDGHTVEKSRREDVYPLRYLCAVSFLASRALFSWGDSLAHSRLSMHGALQD